MNPSQRSSLKLQLAKAEPIYVKYRVPIVTVLVLAGVFRWYASREKTTALGERTVVPQAERERLQHEQDEKMKEAEARRKRGPASAGAAVPAGALVAPGASPNAPGLPAPASPEELKTETMMVYALAANGAGLRFKLKSGATHDQIEKLSAGLADTCLAPAGAANPCKNPITLDQESWTVVTTCAALETLAPGFARVKPAKRFGLSLEPRALKAATDALPVDFELDDVLWKDAAACAAFAKAPPAPVALTKTYALGRGVP